MRVDLFDFDLPEDRIALDPVTPRDAAKMLVVNPHHHDVFSDQGVRDLPGFLRKGDAVIFNDTKVIPAQLAARRLRDSSQGLIEAGIDFTLHMRIAPDRWQAFARPAKKLAANDRLIFSDTLTGTVTDKRKGGDVTITFNKTGPDLDLAIIETGNIPLPPYIAGKRGYKEEDVENYQTIYACEPGAVAAPTAGLHTTERLLGEIKNVGADIHKITLHVGAGTFLPVKTDDTKDHQMHAEIGEITPETAEALNATRHNGGRIIAVGTTSLRLLESATQADGTISPFKGATDIFITPGYHFRAVDLLMTNFHLPKSTLFMLVSAFCGLETMQAAYAHAIENNYRFYSYGDTSLLWRNDLEPELV